MVIQIPICILKGKTFIIFIMASCVADLGLSELHGDELFETTSENSTSTIVVQSSKELVMKTWRD